MTAILLTLLGFAIIGAATIKLVRANRIYTRAVKEIEVLAAKPRELRQHRKQMETKLAELEHYATDLLRRIEKAKIEKTELTSQLETLQARRKDDIFALERIMQPGLDLWEVEVSNLSYFDKLQDEEFKLSWALGRVYLVAAPSETDARRRAELKFLGSQGYRTGKVARTTRF